MGDENQTIYIERFADRLKGPYLEVGSKQYGSTQNLRARFGTQAEYVGADMERGEGVDVVVDFTASFEQVDAALDGKRFGTIFCLSVLEHCDQPFVMAENLTRLLTPGGKVCLSAPLAWKFHGYPSDYWRFTHEGIKKLFGRLVFDEDDGAWATSRPHEFFPLSTEIGKLPLGTKVYRRTGRLGRLAGVLLLRLLGTLGILRWISAYPYVLAPTNIMMIGTRAEDGAEANAS